MRFSYHYSQSTSAGLEVQPSTAAATALATAKTAESLPAPSKGCWHQHVQQLRWVSPAALTAPVAAPVTACSPAQPRWPQPGPWRAGPLAPCRFDPIWTIHCHSHTPWSFWVPSDTDDSVTCTTEPNLVSLYLSPLHSLATGPRCPFRCPCPPARGLVALEGKALAGPSLPPGLTVSLALPQCSGVGAETSPVAKVSKETSAPGTPRLALSSQPIPLFPAQLSPALQEPGWQPICCALLTRRLQTRRCSLPAYSLERGEKALVSTLYLAFHTDLGMWLSMSQTMNRC